MLCTVNGQLLITMLIERLMLKGFKVFMANTDGITTIVPKLRKQEYFDICAQWEKESLLQLEYANYDGMYMSSVNDYIAYDKHKGKAKYKGDFLFERELWKDPSFKIISIALSEYFIKGVKPEEIIGVYPYTYDVFDGKGTKREVTIYDYLGRAKMTQGNKLVERSIIDGEYVEKQLTKTTRYYISTEGKKFIKILPVLEKNLISDVEKMKEMNQTSIFDFIDDVRDDENANRESELHVDKLCTEMNVYIELPFDQYKFDQSFYINECYKIINKIEKKWI